MQIGRLEEIDQAQINHLSKISKVENTDKKHKVDPDDQYKNHMEQGIATKKNEVILDNVQFGFDKDSGEFFVRIDNKNMELQFPTEQIMRMKAHFKDAIEDLNEEINS